MGEALVIKLGGWKQFTQVSLRLNIWIKRESTDISKMITSIPAPRGVSCERMNEWMTGNQLPYDFSLRAVWAPIAPEWLYIYFRTFSRASWGFCFLLPHLEASVSIQCPPRSLGRQPSWLPKMCPKRCALTNTDTDSFTATKCPVSRGWKLLQASGNRCLHVLPGLRPQPPSAEQSQAAEMYKHVQDGCNLPFQLQPLRKAQPSPSHSDPQACLLV